MTVFFKKRDKANASDKKDIERLHSPHSQSGAHLNRDDDTDPHGHDGILELAAADDASPIPVRQFRRRKSLGELVQGIKGKYSREKMVKEAGADSRNTAQPGTNTSAATYSGSQSLFIPNTSQNRHSLPVPVPERSASIPYESLAFSSVSSTPPRLDALPDFALDGFRKSSTFLAGLEKTVDGINTNYGDFTKALITSTSPANSIAVRDKNISKPRCMVPIYVDTSKPRPVIGELWTALKSQGEPLQPSKPVTETSQEHVEIASPLHDSHEADAKCNGAENIDASTASDNVSVATTLRIDEPQESLPIAAADQAADDNLNTGNPNLNHVVSGGANSTTDNNCSDTPNSGDIEAATSQQSADDDSLCSQDVESTYTVSQNTSRDHGSFLTNDGAGNGPLLEDSTRATGANRGRNSSAPSVAALVSKFRRMEQSPENGHHADSQDQDQASLESNSRFIQSYRQRSEDSDNENSLLSTVSSDNAGDGRPKVAVY